MVLEKRYCGYYYSNYDDDCNSAWYDWGRWVLFGGLVLLGLGLFITFSIISSRRRRRLGSRPFYGTGWAAGHAPPQYYPQNEAAPPPAYQTPSNQGYYGGQNQGYYGQQNGVELQPPTNSYQPPRAGDDYLPPSGPPPGKGGDVIR